MKQLLINAGAVLLEEQAAIEKVMAALDLDSEKCAAEFLYELDDVLMANVQGTNFYEETGVANAIEDALIEMEEEDYEEELLLIELIEVMEEILETLSDSDDEDDCEDDEDDVSVLGLIEALMSSR